MKKIGFLVLIILMASAFKLSAQRYTLTINGDTLKHKTTYDYYPNYLRLYVKSLDHNYKIEDGKVTLARNRKEIEKYKLDTNFLRFKELEHDITPRDKIIIDLYKLKDKKTGKTKKTRKFFVIDLASSLDYKPDSTCGLLINNSVSHYKEGFDPDNINEVEILLMGEMKEAPIQLKQYRDDRSVYSKRFNNSFHFNNEAAKVMQNMKFTHEDKLLIDVRYKGEPDEDPCRFFTSVDKDKK